MEEWASAVDRLLELAQTPTQQDNLIATGHAFNPPPIRAVLDLVRVLSPTTLSEVVDRLTPGIAFEDLYQASRIAIICGTLVENGADPRRAMPSIQRRLYDQLDQTRIALQSKGEVSLSAARAQVGHGWMIRAAMTMLARDEHLRLEARKDNALMEISARMRGESDEIGFLAAILWGLDDVLIVLDETMERGFEVKVSGVEINYQLFTMLQDVIPGVNNTNRCSAQFDFCHHRGGWLMGQSPCGTIPLFEGRRIVRLRSRSLGAVVWDENFLVPVHEALVPSVKILRTMLPDEVAQQILRCETPAK